LLCERGQAIPNLRKPKPCADNTGVERQAGSASTDNATALISEGGADSDSNGRG